MLDAKMREAETERKQQEDAARRRYENCCHFFRTKDFRMLARIDTNR